jgi:hypothetical protein
VQAPALAGKQLYSPILDASHSGAKELGDCLIRRPSFIAFCLFLSPLLQLSVFLNVPDQFSQRRAVRI